MTRKELNRRTDKAMFEEKNSPKKGFGFVWAWVLSSLSFLLIFIAHLFNALRKEWFNVDHRSAGQSFAFNIGTFIPLHLAAILLCVISLGSFFATYRSTKRKNLPVTWVDKLSIAPLLPVFVMVGLIAIWAGYLVIESYIESP